MTRKRIVRPTRVDPVPPAPSRRTAPAWACILVLVAAGWWAYAPSFDGVLLLDDMRAIARNPTIRTLWPLTVPLSPPAGATVSARPVANVSFAINYAWAPRGVRDAFVPAGPGGAGDTPARIRENLWGYHLGNLLIHLFSALALFGVVRRTLLSRRMDGRFGEAATPLACCVALVWAVHPLQTEAVTYVVQRVEALMGLFYLLTLYAAARADEGRRAGWWMAASVAAGALGMGTKEVMVTVPLVAAAWFFLFGGADPASRRRQRWLVGALAATWVVLAVLVAGEHRAASVALSGTVIWSYLLTQAQIIVHYVRLSVWPSPLVFLYSWPLTGSWLTAVPYALLVLLALGATVRGLVRRNPLAFPGTAFFLVLAPTSSVLPIVTEVAAEHRMYLPLAALVALLVMGVWSLAGRWRRPLLVTGLAAALVAAPLAVGTRARNRDYASDERLWGDTVAKQPDNQRARVAYGMSLAAAGRLDAAEPELREAVRLAPQDPVANVRLGSILAARGRFDEAIAPLERAVGTRSGEIDAHMTLARIYALRRDDVQALAHLEPVLAALPEDPAVLLQLAGLLVESPAVRDGARAARLVEKAMQVTGRRDPEMLGMLAAARAAARQYDEAARTASDAASTARSQGNTALASELESRAEAYRRLGGGGRAY